VISTSSLRPASSSWTWKPRISVSSSLSRLRLSQVQSNQDQLDKVSYELLFGYKYENLIFKYYKCYFALIFK
jgi:hypothetical protein